jgi:hypothetical protein
MFGFDSQESKTNYFSELIWLPEIFQNGFRGDMFQENPVKDGGCKVFGTIVAAKIPIKNT